MKVSAQRISGITTQVVVLMSLGFVSQALLSFEEPAQFGTVERFEGKAFHCNRDYEWTSETPFMISDSFGNNTTMATSGESVERNWDNFRLMEDSAGVRGFIPQRTIVRLINEDHEGYAEDQAGANIRLPVEIVSVPENGGREFVDKYRRALTDIVENDGMIVEKGQVGRIDSRSLQRAGRFTYLVTENTFLTRVAGLDETEAGQARAVELVTRGEDDEIEYEARKCCLAEDNTRCIYKYRWRVLDGNLEEMASFSLNPFGEEGLECGIMDSIRPIDKEQLAPFLQILETARTEDPDIGVNDIEFIDSMGLIRFPWEYQESDDVAWGEGPYNTSHYNPDGGEAMYDSFINATTGCAFTQVLREWNRRHPERRHEIQVGNMWHAESWGTHSTHEISCDRNGQNCHSHQGTCIDIRPLTTTSARRSGVVNGSGYSRRFNTEFIQLLIAAGADTSRLFFGDSRIARDVEGVTYLRDHADHIHVCFNPSSQAVRDTCQNGL